MILNLSNIAGCLLLTDRNLPSDFELLEKGDLYSLFHLNVVAGIETSDQLNL